jgi:primosomal protein N' (replication factor Y)
MPGLFAQDEDVAVTSRFAKVAVERGIERVGPWRGESEDGTLTYRCPPGIEVGDLVMVPLGRGGSRSAGIVVETGGRELLGRLDAAKVKEVLGRSGARLPRNLLSLARWMAEYYVCPLGMVLATMMPSAVKKGVGVRRRRLIAWGPKAATYPDASIQLSPLAQAAWDSITRLGEGALPAVPRELAARIEARSLGPINRLVRAGLLRMIESEEFVAAPPAVAPANVEQRTVSTPTPTPAQRAVIDGVVASLGSFAVHLLRGVTGSGKTEVYLRVIEAYLGRTGGVGAAGAAIVLVPEISLTPQTAGRFIDRFGGPGGVGVAVLHSGLTAAQRNQQWSQVASGRARVVIGARSAVFAPAARVGIIIVDEEHAEDYKQDQLPRYHARDVAIKRGQQEGCPVLLGSATPSLESWANAVTAGRNGRPKYTLWELTERVAGGRLPRVEVVDIVQDRARGRTSGDVAADRRRFIGPTLSAALGRTLADGGQAILLLNRRGYAHYVGCASAACGWSQRCSECEASMVLHRPSPEGTGGYVRCHHCLAEQRLERRCPVCGGRIIALSPGTQRIEDELVHHFGLVKGRTLLRVDSDTMRGAADYFAALAQFAAGEARVMVGTQMIAKGLDYPNVRLVGVIDADTAINLPDFRAAERTFQLVSQVAGRAGRGEHAGRVIVQTMNPRFPAILMAASHDYRGFAEAELAVRRRSGLPPATRMARIVARDRDHERARRAAADVAEALRQALRSRLAAGVEPGEDGARVDGPADCPFARLGGYWRVGVEVVARRRGIIQEALAAARRRGFVRSDARTAVDVDPISLM